MSSDCLFCGIVAGTVPATLVRRDGDIVAFRDVNPQAPTHILVVPTEHIESAAELTPAHDQVWARLLHVAQSIAEEENLDGDGYRIVVNVGPHGGQTVPHLHLHLLGGRQMTWPPG